MTPLLRAPGDTEQSTPSSLSSRRTWPSPFPLATLVLFTTYTPYVSTGIAGWWNQRLFFYCFSVLSTIAIFYLFNKEKEEFINLKKILIVKILLEEKRDSSPVCKHVREHMSTCAL